MVETLKDAGTIKTYSDEELKFIKEKQIKRNKGKSSKKKYPRGSQRGSRVGKGSRGDPFPDYFGGLNEVKSMKEEKSKLKKGHEPWPEQEAGVMQLGINQLIQKRDVERQELMTTKAGLQDIEQEIQVNVDSAALKAKAANMSLASLLFDQTNDITINKHKNRMAELEHEIERKNHNIEVFQKQLDEGRPKREKPTPKPEPRDDREYTKEELEKLKKEEKKIKPEKKPAPKEGGPKTQEEANNIAGEDEAKASRGQ